MFPLLMADKIGDFIVGTALETIETEKLISEFQQTIIKDVYDNDTPVHQVVSNLQEQIHSKGIQMSKVVMEDVYRPSSVAEQNVTTWLMSKNVQAGSSNVASVSIIDDFLAQWTLILVLSRLLNPGSKQNTIWEVTREGPSEYRAVLLQCIRVTVVRVTVVGFMNTLRHSRQAVYPQRRVSRLHLHPTLCKDL